MKRSKTVNLNNIIYLKDERIYIKPDQNEYDITDHVQELLEELERLKV